MGCKPTTSETECTPTAQTVLAELRGQYPDTPFLALGQTALWDEPTKAALRQTLNSVWPDARMIAAVHDTDYFAKLPGHTSREGHTFALVSHDDARTRGLWSAAGEMSCLFGSEDVPTQHRLEKQAGVSLHKATSFVESPASLLSELTAAWGWTGIIYTEWDRKIARDIRLSEILPTLRQQIEWAIESTAKCLVGNAAEVAREQGQRLLTGMHTFHQEFPQASLTEFYAYLLPRLYEWLLGKPAKNLSTSFTSELLQFNTETATLPRFAVVDLFLNPITRNKAIESYNLAVGGSDIYTLDQFGEGALPFDLVIPGRGRGTLRIPGDGTIFVDTPREPILLCDKNCDFASVESLARLIERELGRDVVLVGKAVSLLPMLAAEFLLVFHEGASGYSSRSGQFVALMQKRKLPVPALRPIVRVRYHTWNSLAAIAPDEDSTIRLPEHLQQALGRDTLTGTDFAYCWQNAVTWEQQRLSELAQLRSPRALFLYLNRVQKGAWRDDCATYEAASETLLALRKKGVALQAEENALREQIRSWKQQAVAIEQQKGDDFRTRVQPLRDLLLDATFPETEAILAEIDRLQVERAERFDTPIATLRQKVREAQLQVRQWTLQRKQLERGETTLTARETLRRIEAKAERERARLARNALQTVNGLPHTNYRPSAWWFPLVNPSGVWFRQLACTAEYSLETLGRS